MTDNVVPFSRPKTDDERLRLFDETRERIVNGEIDGFMFITVLDDASVEVIDCAGPSLTRTLGMLEMAKAAVLEI